MDQPSHGRIVAERDGTVLVLTMAHAPLNAFSAALRHDLADQLAAASADPAIQAIVLRSGLAVFSAGADLGEFDTPPPSLSLAALCHAVEAMDKPVVAAIGGAALGGGLEIALAAHARVASENATMALPEVTLGLVPGAGGTQRLPRLIGAEQALSMILTGRAVPAAEALATGLLDAVVAGDPTGRAKELARDMAGQPPRRSRDRRDGMRDGRAYLAAVDAARRGVAQTRLPAPLRAVDCVAAAQLLPFEQGLAFERTAFVELLATPESAGLRHAFRAERPLLRQPAILRDLAAPSPDSVIVWGAGPRGIDLALRTLSAGLRVTLSDPSREAVVSALESIAGRHEADVAAGRLSPAARDADWARLSTLVAPARLADADAVLLAAAEPPPMSAAMPCLAFGVHAPRQGLQVALGDGPRPLAEIACPAQEAPAALARAYALARRLRWRPVVTGEGGPVSARLAAVLADAVARIERLGHSRSDIAAALSAAGIAGDHGTATLPVAGTAIASRLFAALANAGARLVEAGTVAHPDDIDAIAILSGITARFTGGPMYQADRRGLLVLRRDLLVWAADDPALWSPAPLIDRCLSQGIGLGDLPRR